jgi:hypothetical protein
MTKRIHLISGPRNISTALMYSFGNRKDFTIVDEPLYANYLKVTGKKHPGREETLQSQSSDYNSVYKKVMLKDYSTPFVFLKNMAHHLLEAQENDIAPFHNLFLIRDPAQLIHSFAKVIPQPSMLDIGLEEELKWFTIAQKNGYEATILDSNEVLKNPELVLKKLCQELKINFDENMLSWKAGQRTEDGVWAKYWYKSVHKSTGFKKWEPNETKLETHLVPLYEKALPLYNKLFENAIKA